MVDDVQKARPHKIDGKTVETKRAMPKEVCFWLDRLVHLCRTQNIRYRHCYHQ